MARTKPSNKAKQRAQAMQREVSIDSTVDSEMKSTLSDERRRRVGFKKAGEALTYGDADSKSPLMKRPKGKSITERVGQKLGLTGSDENLEPIKKKIAERNSQVRGARYLNRIKRG